MSDVTNKKQGLLFFHQGFTDIINQLSLIDFYKSKYEKLVVIFREDARGYAEHYCKNKTNVEPVFTPLQNVLYGYQNNILSKFNLTEYDLLFHGYYDRFRQTGDKYIDAFDRAQHKTKHFVEAFFVGYDIEFNVLIDYFNFERDLKLEENAYNKFIQQYGQDYILIHESNERPINLVSNYRIVNLAGITSNMFEYITILQNAKEIHLIDSLWGRFCYLIDAKDSLLKNIPIKIYPFGHENRLGGCIGAMPKLLPNWTII